MIIYNEFYLAGFTRIDKGEEGAVFVRIEYPPEDVLPKPEIISTPMQHGKNNTNSYILVMPKFMATITACAIVKRSSKNCYSATVFDEKRIQTFRSDSLNRLRRIVADFFGV